MVVSDHPVDRLSKDPAILHETLTSIFKEDGALIIEREIARRLLDKAGSEERAASRFSRSWLASALSHRKSAGRVSQKDKELLRGFVGLPFISADQFREEQTAAPSWRGERGSMELTALEFASAFRKGS